MGNSERFSMMMLSSRKVRLWRAFLFGGIQSAADEKTSRKGTGQDAHDAMAKMVHPEGLEPPTS